VTARTSSANRRLKDRSRYRALLASAVGPPCLCCGVLITHSVGGAHGVASAASLDHIMPLRRGRVPPGTRNVRIMCRCCNQRLAQAGDCIGALACLLAMPGKMKRKLAVMQSAVGTAP